MQFVLGPSPLHLYFISRVSHCINSCGVFFAICRQLLESTWLCNGSMFSSSQLSQQTTRRKFLTGAEAFARETRWGGLLLHYLVLPHQKKNKKKTPNKQTHSLPWHGVQLPSQHCVVRRGAVAALQLAGANYELRQGAGSLGAPFR